MNASDYKRMVYAHVLAADPEGYLEEPFTITELQKVHEKIAGIKFHKDTFRRKAIRGGLVQETGEIRHLSQGRPAALYVRSDDACN